MAGLIYCGNNNISCQSVMHVQLCMLLTKFQVHVHILVHASYNEMKECIWYPVFVILCRNSKMYRCLYVQFAYMFNCNYVAA